MLANRQAIRQAPHGLGEFAFDADDFRVLAATLRADSGIALSDQKMPLVYGRLVKRLRLLGLSDFKDYCALVTGVDGAAERQHMLAALTTNVTRFLREPHHFKYLRTSILPGLLAEARKGKRVRIWSAGCSSGQEPYSLAMTILTSMPDAASHDIKILATDIDPNMIAIGRAGVYGDADVVDIAQADLARFFLPSKDEGERLWKVVGGMQRLVTFRELNLMGNWPMRGPFDVIFCRNVVIYFDNDVQASMWSRFAELMEQGSTLCIGHSERISGAAKALFRLVDTTAYERVAADR